MDYLRNGTRSSSRPKVAERESMDDLPASFPVRHRKFSSEIKVVVTQIGTMGTILHARKEEGMSVEPTFSVSVILGKRDEPMLTATGGKLIEHISHSAPSKPLVLSLGLKDHSMETLKEIVASVIETAFDNI